MAYKYNSTRFRIEDVETGQETEESLRASKARFEGGNAILTSAIQAPSRSQLSKSIHEYYGSICEALEVLQRAEE